MAEQEGGGEGAVPARCPTCETEIPAGRARCPGCGRVFGEDNRCPHCNAIAAVRRSMGKPLCAACGGPREVHPGTIVLGDAPGGSALGPRASRAPSELTQAVARGGSAGMRVFGVLSLAGGVLAATLAAAVLPGAVGIVAAIAVGAAGVGLGGLALRSASQASKAAEQRQRTAREHAVIDAAREAGGELTATQAARALGLGVEQADALLTDMAKGGRIGMEVSDEGIVRYVFGELEEEGEIGEGPARARVAIDDEIDAHAPTDEQRAVEEPAELEEREPEERSRSKD